MYRMPFRKMITVISIELTPLAHSAKATTDDYSPLPWRDRSGWRSILVFSVRTDIGLDD